MIKLFTIHNKQKSPGFTLVEVLVALAITGLIMGGITTGIIQLMTISDQNTNAITAQRQVQQVGTAISQDVLQSRIVQTSVNNTPAGTGFQIVLTWNNINGDEYVITYSLSNSGIVTRSQSINGGAATSSSIAENISISSLDTSFIQKSGSPGTYTLKVTATIPGQFSVSETRTYEMKKRTN